MLLITVYFAFIECKSINTTESTSSKNEPRIIGGRKAVRGEFLGAVGTIFLFFHQFSHSTIVHSIIFVCMNRFHCKSNKTMSRTTIVVARLSIRQ